MKDEIKEILDKLKDNDWYEEGDLTGTKWIELRQEETNLLYDYITNLQTIEQQYSAILSENAELENKITNLQEKYEEAYNYLDKFIPNEYGVLLTERQWEYVKKILGGDDNAINSK